MARGDYICQFNGSGVDVNPLSVGIETVGGIFSAFLKRNSVIPNHKTKEFTTSVDSQTCALINIYEGERALVSDNYHVSSFIFEDITPLPRGTAKVQISFECNCDGILTVTVIDLPSGTYKKINIFENSR